jgi:hypothetical protein
MSANSAVTGLRSPSIRHGVIELVKADGRIGNGANAARGEKVPAALDAMLMQRRCSRSDSESAPTSM